jgi:selenium-binding protein 1
MKALFLKSIIFTLTIILLSACEKEPDFSARDVNSDNGKSSLKSAPSNKGFVHGIVLDIDGIDYYFEGAPDSENGAYDIPGHNWVQASPSKVVGKHYNTGPFGAPSWWSSDAEDGALLYIVDCIIDTWSMEKALAYYDRGYVHYHEFRSVTTGELHPNKVAWLKHTAVTSFTLDGGPGQPDPPYEHTVTPGVDPAFPNNSFNPYP